MKKEAKHAGVKIQSLPIAQLKAHPKNPRIHPAPGSSEWKLIKKSLEHDYFDPLVFNKRNGMLVSGHLRRKVLAEAGYTTVDCVIVDYDEPTHIAKMIAGNTHGGQDDNALLAKLAEEMSASLIDMELTGRTMSELRSMVVTQDEEDAAGLQSDVTDEIPNEREAFIVPIALTRKQWALWQKKKEALGIKRCRTAFLKITGIE